MNATQKIFVMIGVGSIVVFIISIAFLEFSFTKPFSAWVTGLKNDKGFAHSKTNWLGIISAFNLAVSATGFFLFKNK